MIALCIVSALLLITNAAWWLLWGESENEIKRLKGRDRDTLLNYKRQLAVRFCEDLIRPNLGGGDPGWKSVQENNQQTGAELEQLIDDVEQNRR